MSGNIVAMVLRQGLYTRTIGQRILYFQRLTSTMDKAVEEAEAGAAEGTVILTEEQTAGRGRFQRPWVSPAGNLYLSVVLRPSTDVLPYLSLLAGLAVARAIMRITHLLPTIKWPNDVRLQGKKVCGILVEGARTASQRGYSILGMGINVNTHPGEVSSEVAPISTSLSAEVGRPVARDRLLRHLLQELDGLYVAAEGGNVPIEEWRDRLDTLGRQVEVRWGDEVYTGHAEDVDKTGNLVLRLEDGSRITLLAGEVTLQTGSVEDLGS